MSELSEHTIDCPYCGERIDVLIDPSVEQQDYVEDCQVCCRPIHFSVTAEPDGSIELGASGENE
jgi:hypothetical protein